MYGDERRGSAYSLADMPAEKKALILDEAAQ
jgi:hypothetical protein